MKQTWMVALIVTVSAMGWTAECSAGFPRPFRWIGEGWSDGYHTPGERWNQPPKQAWSLPMPPIQTYPLHTHPWRSVPSGPGISSADLQMMDQEEIPMESIQARPYAEDLPLEVPGPNAWPRARGFLPPN